MPRFVLLVGTMTGNAEFAAEEMQQVLVGEFGREAEVRLMDGLGADAFDPAAVYILCTSTYGEGEVPENAKALHAALCERRPDLGGVRYAVYGLGDSSYQATFGYGGKRFDELLAALGATRLGERGTHDIRSGTQPWDEGRAWIRAWYAAHGRDAG